jgi:hypothetical protein
MEQQREGRIHGWILWGIASFALMVVAGCTPTPQPRGGVTTGCEFPQDQTSTELRVNCTVISSPTNVLIDPLDSANRSCSLSSFSLFSQALAAQATFIYGEDNGEWAEIVQIGVIVGESTHRGRLAKSSGFSCESTSGPIVDLTTIFSGRHKAFVNKVQVPRCVYRSRYTGETFKQTGVENFTGIGGNLSFAMRAATEDAIAKQLDLEAARAANRLVGLGSSLDAAFEGRFGRCADDYRTYEGD